MVEPGRSIVATTGTLLCSVLGTKVEKHINTSGESSTHPYPQIHKYGAWSSIHPDNHLYIQILKSTHLDLVP